MAPGEVVVSLFGIGFRDRSASNANAVTTAAYPTSETEFRDVEESL